MIRKPAVAGYFYEGSEASLRRQVEGFILPAEAKVKALGILSPHAGLMYSGSVAGAVYSRIDIPGTIILIGPNHTGMGAPVSIMAKGAWETPLGRVEIDETLASCLLNIFPQIQDDNLAHVREHSLEVQLPFIQYFRTDFTIVPIQLRDVRLETCLSLGGAVARAIEKRKQEKDEAKRDVLIIASSDMTHYESAGAARQKDEQAIRRILDLDPENLHRTVRELGITMCGFGPAVAMLAACRELGATRAELVKYANSGDISGDFKQVVGYAGILIV